jgi:hypothetical protein
MSTHAINPARQLARDTAEIVRISGAASWKAVRRHVFGVVVVAVALVFTGSVVVGLVMEGEQLAAILAGWIGGLGIGIGITYHLLGETRP